MGSVYVGGGSGLLVAMMPLSENHIDNAWGMSGYNSMVNASRICRFLDVDTGEIFHKRLKLGNGVKIKWYALNLIGDEVTGLIAYISIREGFCCKFHDFVYMPNRAVYWKGYIYPIDNIIGFDIQEDSLYVYRESYAHIVCLYNGEESYYLGGRRHVRCEGISCSISEVLRQCIMG